MTAKSEITSYDLSLSKVSSTNVPAQLTDLYVDAFPADERRPLAMWLRMLGQGTFHAYSILYKGVFAGFITLWRLGAFFYIEHFAVLPSMRGNGVGSAALRAIDSITGALPIVVEVEPQSCGAIAERRIDFYKRNGFVDFPRFHYMQPPYCADTQSIALMLMVKNYHSGGPTVAYMAERIRKAVYFV